MSYRQRKRGNGGSKPTLERSRRMRSKSQKWKTEWDYFINPATGKVQYNRQCQRCVCEDCKQSHRAVIVLCKYYERKRKGAVYVKHT
jgi:hypothetical protein